MPEEEVHGSDSENQSQPSEVEKLRAQFTEQFNTQKDAYESQLAKLTEENTSLKTHVEELQRSLIRASMVTPAKQEPELTKEQIYERDVNALAQVALDNWKKQIGAQ